MKPVPTALARIGVTGVSHGLPAGRTAGRFAADFLVIFRDEVEARVLPISHNTTGASACLISSISASE